MSNFLGIAAATSGGVNDWINQQRDIQEHKEDRDFQKKQRAALGATYDLQSDAIARQKALDAAEMGTGTNVATPTVATPAVAPVVPPAQSTLSTAGDVPAGTPSGTAPVATGTDVPATSIPTPTAPQPGQTKSQDAYLADQIAAKQRRLEAAQKNGWSKEASDALAQINDLTTQRRGLAVNRAFADFGVTKDPNAFQKPFDMYGDGIQWKGAQKNPDGTYVLNLSKNGQPFTVKAANDQQLVKQAQDYFDPAAAQKRELDWQARQRELQFQNDEAVRLAKVKEEHYYDAPGRAGAGGTGTGARGAGKTQVDEAWLQGLGRYNMNPTDMKKYVAVPTDGLSIVNDKGAEVKRIPPDIANEMVMQKAQRLALNNPDAQLPDITLAAKSMVQAEQGGSPVVKDATGKTIGIYDPKQTLNTATGQFESAIRTADGQQLKYPTAQPAAVPDNERFAQEKTWAQGLVQSGVASKLASALQDPAALQGFTQALNDPAQLGKYAEALYNTTGQPWNDQQRQQAGQLLKRQAEVLNSFDALRTRTPTGGVSMVEIPSPELKDSRLRAVAWANQQRQQAQTANAPSGPVLSPEDKFALSKNGVDPDAPSALSSLSKFVGGVGAKASDWLSQNFASRALTGVRNKESGYWLNNAYDLASTLNARPQLASTIGATPDELALMRAVLKRSGVEPKF